MPDARAGAASAMPNRVGAWSVSDSTQQRPQPRADAPAAEQREVVLAIIDRRRIMCANDEEMVMAHGWFGRTGIAIVSLSPLVAFPAAVRGETDGENRTGRPLR